jgi:hypothetical protein
MLTPVEMQRQNKLRIKKWNKKSLSETYREALKNGQPILGRHKENKKALTQLSDVKALTNYNHSLRTIIVCKEN